MKKLVYILVGLVFAVVAGGGYWMLNKKPPQENIKRPPVTATSTQTTSSETKTYKNEEFGFEFEYPKNWSIRREDKNVNNYSRLLLIIGAPVIYNNEERFDYAFLLNIVVPKFVETDFWKSNERGSVVVGGVEGKKYEYEYQGFPQTDAIIPLGELKLIAGTGEGEKQYLDEFNQILSSFKFLK